MLTIDHLDVSSMEESARSWMDALFQRVRDEPPSDAQPLCELIVGVHLCNALAPKEQSAARSATIQDAASLMEQQFGADAFATVAPTMKLLTATLLRAYGTRVTYLDHYLELSVKILDEPNEDQDIDTMLGHMEKRALLSGANLMNVPDILPDEAIGPFLDTLALPASPREIDELILRAEAISGWGLHANIPAAPDPRVAPFLRGFAISAFREYDLLTGCKCLRALIHLDFLEDATDLATFVARQQRPDGSFGFLGPEQAELGALAAWVDSDTALYLPMTVQCLWSLAEWHRRDWRLFRDIPAVA